MKNNLEKPLAVLIVLFMLLPTLVGCGAPAPVATSKPAEPVAEEATKAPEPAPEEEIVLQISLGAEPENMDPNLSQDTFSITCLEGTFLGLTNINNATDEIEPELATGWEVSKDGLVCGRSTCARMPSGRTASR